MAILGSADAENADNAPNPTKKLRWATQRLTGKSGNKKRGSILGRIGRKTSQSSEKKRDSAGGDSMGTMGTDLGAITEEPEPAEGAADSSGSDRDGQGPRTVFFNQPLPPDMVDEQGYPTKHYRRNKIRTAKYTPISFIPKNLFYQFHNIANVYFLFLIILTVRLK
jgi:phospholipid-translocating ATPase